MLSKLPITRATRLLRLIGAGAVLRKAITELKALSDAALQRRIALPIRSSSPAGAIS